MSISNEFIDYVTELLEPVGPVSVSRMFGGALIKVRNIQLGIIIDDRLFFKITDKLIQGKYQTQGSEQFSYLRKDKKEPIIIKNWWSVPTAALDDSDLLVELAEEALNQES